MSSANAKICGDSAGTLLGILLHQAREVILRTLAELELGCPLGDVIGQWFNRATVLQSLLPALRTSFHWLRSE
jgi:hypothetical protein